MPTQIIDVNWRECEKTGSYTFLTDMDHIVRVKKHSIPIVFIPGIMGSRLRGSNGPAWDPDDSSFMLWNYIRTGAETHKKLLIDDTLSVMTAQNSSEKENKALVKRFAESSSLKLDWDWLPMPANGSPAGGTPKERTQKIAQLLVDHGWGEVALGFYEQILFAMASANFGSLHRCFVFPVYACGYNWVNDNDQSGNDLAKVIQPIIDKEKAIPGRECDRVILVSHSMGGLASRSAMMLHGFKGKCFGAIHGAQPVTGAPAAYRRMRAGAEGAFDPSAYVIGHTSALVMPVLANCAGGLELLPTKLYVDDKNKKTWLNQKDSKGNVIGKALPTGNPYDEIYRSDDGFLKLILHPELLNPGGAEQGKPSLKAARADTPKSNFQRKVEVAETFHDKLGLQQHDQTAFAYVKDGLPTYDGVTFRYQRDLAQMQYSEADGSPIGIEPVTQTEGSGVDLDVSRSPQAYFQIEGPTGTGDGTVPMSSGRALPASFLTPPEVTGTEHSQFYNNATVRTFTIKCIANLAEAYRKSQV